MVHPVGFAGYGFQQRRGRPLKGEGAGLASIRISLLGDLLFWVGASRNPNFGKMHRQSIRKRLLGAVVHLYCGRGDCRQDF